MPKNCINCNAPISGTGQNKIFCSNCLKKIAPFFRFIGKSSVPAKKLYELNFERLKGMGLSELTLSYIEKCCIRYDENRPAVPPLHSSGNGDRQESAPASISSPENTVSNEKTEKKSDEILISGISEIEKSTVSDERSEDNDISEESGESYDLSSVPTPIPVMPSELSENVNESEDDENIENDEDDEDDEDELGVQKRIILIICAAVSAFLIFLSLFIGGILPEYSPKHENDTSNDNVIGVDTSSSSKDVDSTDTDTADDGEETGTYTDICVHEWTSATCTSPKTCSLCGETEGDPLGHDFTSATCTLPMICTRCVTIEGEPLGHEWTEATCTSPQTCVVCGETNGAALDHNFKYDSAKNDKVCTYCGKTQLELTGVRACEHVWADATCTASKVCSVCGEKVGEPLGHKWASATCTSPKTCETCGLTEGEPLSHDFSDATCTSPKTCSLCGETEGDPLGHINEGIKCSRCGKYFISLSSVGTEAHDESGLSVLVESIEVTPTENGKLYYVKYTVTNNSQDSMLEGAFKIFLAGGGGIDTPGVAYTTLDPDASVTHTYTFEVPDGKTPLILEYYHDGGILIFRNEPHTSDEALYWELM